VLRILAVDREWADVLKTSALTATRGKETKDDYIYDAQLETTATGATFHVEGLLTNRAYDLIVWTRGNGANEGQEIRWEGINMDYHRDIRPSTAATPDDRKAIEAAITEPAQFYDKVHVLAIAADHQHATAAVELIRTRDFHSDKGGEVIYRVETWYYENLYGGWAKDRNTEKVVARVRGNPATLPQTWQFLPALGGRSPGPDSLKLTLPDKPDPKHGIVGGVH
jgi:hypothetical protein